MAAQSDAIVPAVPRPDDSTLRELETMDDVLALLEKQGIPVRDIADEIGTGFSVVDKETLVKVPMVLIAWQFSVGDFGGMVTAFAMTEDGRKVILVDGSTGIFAQLDEYSNDPNSPGFGIQNGMRVRNGLRVSRYELTEDREIAPRDYKGKTTPAATFYLDTSK
jgi:hypothetical protein